MGNHRHKEDATEANVSYRLTYENPDLNKKKRKCLGCGKDFNSKWEGNRMCQPCKTRITVGHIGRFDIDDHQVHIGRCR